MKTVMSKMLGIFILSFIAIQSTYAMRCADKLVYEGDSSYTVLKKCGDPAAKQVYEQSTPVYNWAGYQIGVNTTVMEVWIYQKSSADFQYEVVFNNNVVKEIRANRNP